MINASSFIWTILSVLCLIYIFKGDCYSIFYKVDPNFLFQWFGLLLFAILFTCLYILYTCLYTHFNNYLLNFCILHISWLHHLFDLLACFPLFSIISSSMLIPITSMSFLYICLFLHIKLLPTFGFLNLISNFYFHNT